MIETRQERVTKKGITSFLAGVAMVVSVVVLVSCAAVAEPLVDIIQFAVTPGLFVDLDASSVSFILNPDHAPTSTASRAVTAGTNASPTIFSIALPVATGPDFSYRMVKEGEGAPAWQDIPIIPAVASQELPGSGETNYTLDLRATAGPDLSAGSYQADLQLQFQGAGTIWSYTLHLDITVLGRAPVVDAGPDQTVNEGDVVDFTGSFADPDTGETYTISWDFGDGATASGTLTPTHTYLDNRTYTVTLTVTDNGGRAGHDTLTVVANDLGPTARVESVPPVAPPLTLAVVAGKEVTFDASGSTSNPDAIVSYEWDWDYGGLAGFTPSGDTGEVVTHVFGMAGTYFIAVRVTDDDGSTDIATLEVVVNPVTTTEVSLVTPEVAGAGGAVVPEVAIDELYVHHQALAVPQFHLVSPEAPEQPSSPVIYFSFDEGEGEYTYDEIDSQLGRDPILEGTLHQMEWIEGAMGLENQFALSLGEDGYMELPPDPRMDLSWNQDFTLELWVRTTDSIEERVLVQRQAAGGGPMYGLSLVAGAPLFYTVDNTGNYAIVNGRESIANGAWHHIACIRNTGMLLLYIDGELTDQLALETHIAGAGGSNLSSDEPAYFGGLGKKEESLGGLVDAVYYIGESIEFRVRIADETGAPVTDAHPLLLFIRYNNSGLKLSSGFIGRLEYNPDEEEYAYSLDTSTYEEGVYDFFLVSGDGSQERLRTLLIEVE
jgi:PKD repeat protein